MKRFLLIFVLLFTIPYPAKAGSGDLLNDSGIDSSTRPSVPSDVLRRNDMMPTPPPLLDQDYDILESNARPRYISPNADMMDHSKRHVDYGGDDMLVEHPINQPYYPLFHRQQP